jgi:hypothetical protein
MSYPQQTNEDVQSEDVQSADCKYEKQAIFFDALSTTGLGAATLYEESMLQYLLGVGTIFASAAVVWGREQPANRFIQTLQPVLGTLAAITSVAYASMGQPNLAVVMGGLSASCYANSLSHRARGKKIQPNPNGLVGILDEVEEI